MPSDVPRLRYILPRFNRGYTLGMKTLSSSLKFDSSDPAKFRLHVLKHGKKHGVQSAIEAFGISRRTFFNWKKLLNSSKGRLSILVPKSTCPKRTRKMIVDDRVVDFIKEIREEYGRIGKYKLKILVDEYIKSLGIAPYGATKLGKIIKRNHFFFDPPRRKREMKFQRNRIKYAPKVFDSGHVQMDSIHAMVSTKKVVFITVIDLATKVAYAEKVKTASSYNASLVLKHFQEKYQILIHTIQTDNGSEFLGKFNEKLEKENIKHLFSYPRSPRINGTIERFNRTFQEEHVQRTIEWWCDPETANQKLTKYLKWYNEVRPHASLKYITPLNYFKIIT